MLYTIETRDVVESVLFVVVVVVVSITVYMVAWPF